MRYREQRVTAYVHSMETCCYKRNGNGKRNGDAHDRGKMNAGNEVTEMHW